MPYSEKQAADGRRQTLFLTCTYGATSNQVSYIGFGAGQGVNTTESARQITINHDFVLKRILAEVSTNGKDHATIIGFRDDSSTIGSISVGIGSTGQKDSGVLNVQVASGSLCNIIVDTSTSTDGNNLTVPVILVEIELLN